jgi:hypothetical protein
MTKSEGIRSVTFVNPPVLSPAAARLVLRIIREANIRQLSAREQDFGLEEFPAAA